MVTGRTRPPQHPPPRQDGPGTTEDRPTKHMHPQTFIPLIPSNPPQAPTRHDKPCHTATLANHPKTMEGVQGTPGTYTPCQSIPQGPKATPVKNMPQYTLSAASTVATTSKHGFCLIFVYHFSLQVFENFKQSPRR